MGLSPLLSNTAMLGAGYVVEFDELMVLLLQTYQ